MFNRSYILGHETHPHFISDNFLRDLKKQRENTAEHAELRSIFRALSDKTKLDIYFLLHRVEEMSVSDICIALSLSASAASHALSDMKALGLIESVRCGQLVCYRLKSDEGSFRRFRRFIRYFFMQRG